MSTTTKKQKDKNTSKKKEILYKDNTSGITYYSDGSTSKIKKEESKDKDSPEKKQWVKRSGTRTGPSTVKSTQKKAEKAVVAKAKANRDTTQTVKSTEKKYAAKSMFPKTRDDAKTTTGKARPFKEAFDSATKLGKSKFLWKGKGYLTTKGKREDRFDPTKTKAAPAGKEQRQILKRVKWMEKRKEAGKGYSAKNLAELTKKLEELNIR